MRELKEPAGESSMPSSREAPEPPPSTTAASTSLALLLRARRGESSAIELLFGRLLPSLSRWARGRLPRWARRRLDTDDLVQEAFGAFFRRIPHLEPRRKQAIRAYLRESIRNRIKDEVRRAGRVEVSVDALPQPPLQEPSPLEKAVATEELRRYREALGRLGPGDRDLVVGRMELDLSYEQLALATGRPSSDAARMATRRALLRLAEGMNPE